MPTDKQIEQICSWNISKQERSELFHECKVYLYQLKEEMLSTPKEKRAAIKEKYNKEYYKAKVIFGTWRNLYSY